VGEFGQGQKRISGNFCLGKALEQDRTQHRAAGICDGPAVQMHSTRAHVGDKASDRIKKSTLFYIFKTIRPDTAVVRQQTGCQDMR
jgi:hypothetical protein